MYAITINGNGNICTMLRGVIGNCKVEAKTKNPRMNVFDKHSDKIINTMRSMLASAFRQTLKDQIPFSEAVFPETTVKLYNELINIPQVYTSLFRKNGILEFVDGKLAYPLQNFDGGTLLADWMKKKGEAFRALNSVKAKVKAELNETASLNLSNNIPAGSKALADTAINLYNSRSCRPSYKVQSDLMMKLLGSTCLCCGDHDAPSCDHVVPKVSRCDLAKSILNMQPLCGNCNSGKGATHKDYRSNVQMVSLFTKAFKYKVKPAEVRVMTLYVEYGLTRAQIKQVLDIEAESINAILQEHESFLTNMEAHIRGRRNYRLAYEARGVDTVSLFK